MKRVIAVDLGATNIRVGVVEDSRIVMGPIIVATPERPSNAGEITDLLIGSIRHLTGTGRMIGIRGIGISAAGPVDHNKGSIIRPPNITLAEIPVVDILETEFRIPVRVINDCHAGILGEVYFGDPKPDKNAVYITMSTGIGAGIISGGKIFLGRNGNAGEVGHFFVDDYFHIECGCGYPGHWESYSSGHFLPEFFMRWCRDKGLPLLISPGSSPDQVFLSIHETGEEYLEFVEDLGRINARGVSDIIVAYEPEQIIFDGSVVRENIDMIIPYIKKYIDGFLPPPLMTISSLGGRAPILGASVIALGYDTMIGNFLPRCSF